MDGTWKEVVDALGIAEGTMRYYLSPSYIKRIKKKNNKRLKIEPIGEIVDGEEILYEDND
jgi:predicted site-specific integrase-resolvase